MKNKLFKILLPLAISAIMVATVFLMVACPLPSDSPPELTGITIALPAGAPTAWVVNEDGEGLPSVAQRTFIATAQPNNAELSNVVWTSSNPDVVRVENNVAMLPITINEGHAYITATVDGFTSNTVRITVAFAPPEAPPLRTGFTAIESVAQLNAMTMDGNYELRANLTLENHTPIGT
ncbi:MAG: Ig-like domain-containing protein, partial [Firmicutes bacterium]|nr:Ig-like domain-containing protein [Bacillota bacterium]